jgi:caspase domain-containing protein
VVFVLSPEAVISPRCAWEVDKAIALAKRLIPVIGKTVRDEDVPERLRRLNYVFLSEGSSYARGLGQVAEALRADLDWIREHTRLAELTRRWQQRGRIETLLLRDDELVAAQAWKAARKPDAPEVTDEQLAFIAASVDAQAAREERDRQQRDEFAKAQTARAEALGERERAVASLRRRTLLAGIGAGIASLGLGALGYSTWLTQGRLRDERDRADKAQAASVEALRTREAGRTDIEGQLVAFAASPGEYASDGVPGEQNSPYTKRLLEELDNPDASFQDALSRAGRKVLDLTRSAQRPYLATDLNGDVYLRRKPPSRQCQAIVVAVDQVGTRQFQNVLRDGTAWARFLEACGFEVTHLANPTHQDVISAVEKVHFSTTANTCLFFFFSGGGIKDGADLLLLPFDSINRKELVVRDRAIDVAMLTTAMRKAAAASILVLDTAFPPARG